MAELVPGSFRVLPLKAGRSARRNRFPGPTPSSPGAQPGLAPPHAHPALVARQGQVKLAD
jgi:hypothetical protein